MPTTLNMSTPALRDSIAAIVQQHYANVRTATRREAWQLALEHALGLMDDTLPAATESEEEDVTWFAHLVRACGHKPCIELDWLTNRVHHKFAVRPSKDDFYQYWGTIAAKFRRWRAAGQDKARLWRNVVRLYTNIAFQMGCRIDDPAVKFLDDGVTPSVFFDLCKVTESLEMEAHIRDVDIPDFDFEDEVQLAQAERDFLSTPVSIVKGSLHSLMVMDMWELLVMVVNGGVNLSQAQMR